ncbi:metal-nicotianamine transporter YSL7 [Fagus crenata]
MQDFKSQDWISITLASPRSIFFSQVFGTAMVCFMSPLIFWFFYKVYSVGNPDGSYPAPYGLMYRGIALLGVEGLRVLVPFPKLVSNLLSYFSMLLSL